MDSPAVAEGAEDLEADNVLDFLLKKKVQQRK